MIFTAAPNEPAKNRNTMSWFKLVLTAQAMLKMTKRNAETWYNGNRPNISDRGAMTATCQCITFCGIISISTRLGSERSEQ